MGLSWLASAKSLSIHRLAEITVDNCNSNVKVEFWKSPNNEQIPNNKSQTKRNLVCF
jgi:post-segregation antitoxin (ccd killing protein)